MALSRPRSSFQTAGGVIIKFRHPFLTGQLSKDSLVDEVDVSSSLKLNDNFFQANPAQDSASQEPLVDGSVITITNHMMNGQLTLQVLSTTGFVGTGDLIACAHLIVASKDDVGGTLTVIRNFNGKKRVRVYLGVSFKNVPHELIAGNSVVPYPVVMLYTTWFEGLGAAGTELKTIWAAGNKYGIKAKYMPYSINGTSVAKKENPDYYSGAPTANVDGDAASAMGLPSEYPDGESMTDYDVLTEPAGGWPSSVSDVTAKTA
jgi:hypothetical protein